MRVLLIHNEATYFGGAEKMLGYYLEGLRGADVEIAVAAVAGTRVSQIVPPSIRQISIPGNQPFSARHLAQQIGILLRRRSDFRFDLLHAWTARDWELASLVGRMTRTPAMGTLHDHPRASFISPARQRLMGWCATWGLRHLVCVSDAVRSECSVAGYPTRRLSTIHNGLPFDKFPPNRKRAFASRIGFLGTFSKEKGFRGLFAALDQLEGLGGCQWEALLAGDAQNAEGGRLVADVTAQYSSRAWWPRIRWLGWVNRPADFLSSIDVLLMPSIEFDSFPTVLLEAGISGVPVVATRVGGVEEIVQDGVTGLLFEPGGWEKAAQHLHRLLCEPSLTESLGTRASAWVSKEFTVAKMVAKHLELYSTLKL